MRQTAPSRVVGRELPAPRTTSMLITLEEAVSETGLSRTKLTSLLMTGELTGEQIGAEQWLVDLASAKAVRRRLPSGCSSPQAEPARAARGR